MSQSPTPYLRPETARELLALSRRITARLRLHRDLRQAFKAMGFDAQAAEELIEAHDRLEGQATMTDRTDRDPLTLRVRRTLAETRSDPHAFCEGPHEPQLLAGVPPWEPRRGFDITNSGHHWVVRIGVVGTIALVALIILGVL